MSAWSAGPDNTTGSTSGFGSPSLPQPEERPPRAGYRRSTIKARQIKGRAWLRGPMVEARLESLTARSTIGAPTDTASRSNQQRGHQHRHQRGQQPPTSGAPQPTHSCSRVRHCDFLSKPRLDCPRACRCPPSSPPNPWHTCAYAKSPRFNATALVIHNALVIHKICILRALRLNQS